MIAMQGFKHLTSLLELDLTDNNISSLSPQLVRMHWTCYVQVFIMVSDEIIMGYFFYKVNLYT